VVLAWWLLLFQAEVMIYGELKLLNPERELHGKGEVTVVRKNLFLSSVFCAALACGGVILAQGPAANIDPNKHPSLAEAQHHILEAYQKIDAAQTANKEELAWLIHQEQKS
jgi:hypothetical protein